MSILLSCCIAAKAGTLQAANAQAAAPSQAMPTQAGVFGGDARLARKVRLRVEGLPIKELLALLSQQSGVDLRAQEDIGDEKVVLFQPARALQATLVDLAALFNNQWERIEQPGQPLRYRLIRTARAREYEDTLAHAWAQRYTAQMQQMVSALGETPEQLARRPTSDVVRACLLNPERRLATQFYAGLSEAQQLQIFEEGATDDVPFSALAPEQQEQLLAWRDALEAKIQNPQAGEANGSLKGLSGISNNVSRDDLTQGTLCFISTAGPFAQRTTVRLLAGGTGSLMLRSLYEPPASRQATHADPYTRRLVTDVPATLTIEALNTAAAKSDWMDRLRALSEATQLPVMSDYFRTNYTNYTDGNKTASATPQALGDGVIATMDRFCESYQRLWWTRGQTLLLRCVSWPTMRDYEVPDRWILNLCRQIHAHNDAPTFADLYAVLTLTPKQMAGLAKMYNVYSANLGRPKTLNTRAFLEMVRVCLFNDSQPLPPDTTDRRPASDLITYATMPAAARAYLPAVLGRTLPALLLHPERFRAGVYVKPVSLQIDEVGRDAPPELVAAAQKLHEIARLYALEKDAERREQLAQQQNELSRKAGELLWQAHTAGDKRVQRTDVINTVLYQRGGRLTVPGTTMGYSPVSTIFLPLRLPDDRRDKTEVEVTPK